MRNSGGATADGIEWFASGFDDYVVEPAFASIGTLKKGESVPLVVRVTRTGNGDPCDLLDVRLGLRFYVLAKEPVWFWAPAFAVSADSACAPFVVGGAGPQDLPAPLWMPGNAPPGLPSSTSLMTPALQYLGTSSTSGALPTRPARPALPTIRRPL